MTHRLKADWLLWVRQGRRGVFADHHYVRSADGCEAVAEQPLTAEEQAARQAVEEAFDGADVDD